MDEDKKRDAAENAADEIKKDNVTEPVSEENVKQMCAGC